MGSNFALLLDFVQEQGVTLVVDELVELDFPGRAVVVADAVVLDRSLKDITCPTV